MAPATDYAKAPAPLAGKSTTVSNAIRSLVKTCCNRHFIIDLLLDPAKLPLVSIGILLVELVLNVIVVQRVKYTEIDWIAYMQECEGFLNGTTNYSLLKGDTGPLVYPAGFVYIYTAFYYLTSHGRHIRLAQYCFVGIYLLQMYLVLRIYTKVRKVPPYVLLITTFTSYRIHSIYVLRLFNDPIAIVFLYAAVNCYLSGRWSWGSVFLSLGVSVKMNVLLFAPAILLLFLVSLGFAHTVKQLAICAVIQLILGAPFLLTHPVEYLRGSFDLGRIFDHKWTVNYRFLPVQVFEHRYFHLALLAIHLALLLVFAWPSFNYLKSYRNLRCLQSQSELKIEEFREEAAREAQAAAAPDAKSTLRKRKKKKASDDSVPSRTEPPSVIKRLVCNAFDKMLQKACSMATSDGLERSDNEEYFGRTTQLAVLPIFLANFIGMVCARSLHYQFYIWYFHSLPYLAWYTDYNLSVKFLLLGMIEMAWNTYPSTDLSSALLHISHLVLLAGIGRKFFQTVIDGRRHAQGPSADATNGSTEPVAH